MLCSVGNSGSPGYRARRRERERRQQGQAERATIDRSPTLPGRADSRERRAAPTTCGWCGGPITPRSRGPIPKWCSAACRHPAWEQARAAASGLSAVRVVERRVEVPTPVCPTRRDWPGLLHELARQLGSGRVYDRDLPELAVALNAVLEAFGRRRLSLGAHPDSRG